MADRGLEYAERPAELMCARRGALSLCRIHSLPILAVALSCAHKEAGKNGFPGSKANNAEVDYVVALGPRIVPVEVKAGAGGSLKSLQQFVMEKNGRQAVRFDLNPSSKVTAVCRARLGQEVHDVTFELLSLPLYAVEEL